MKTLSTQDLELVTGGGKPVANIGGDGSDQLLTTLQGIQSSIKDLSKNQNSMFGGPNGLLFMTMAFALSRRSEVVVHSSGGACRGRFCWRW